MTKHDERPEVRTTGGPVLDGQHRVTGIRRILATYDATPHVGLSTIVCDAAIERVDEMGEETVELPKPRELRAAAAIARCLMPIRLQGWEIKAMRKIMRLTLAEFAKRLDERTAVETVSRWEADAQPMGGYAERIIRLLVCEELKKEAPGSEYNASMIANLKVYDPWKVDPSYKVPTICLKLIKLKEQPSGSIIETWNAKLAA
jgi:DNA-binding transcriptional regulator YiaG